MISNAEKWEMSGTVVKLLLSEYKPDQIVLAGGAVRDYLNSRPIKDFDFYIYNMSAGLSQRFKMDRIKTQATKKGFWVSEVDKSVYKGTAKVLKIKCALVDYDIIFVPVDRVSQILSSFDFNICKCVYSFTKMDFITTPSYRGDIDNKTLTLDLRVYQQDEDRIYSLGKAISDHLPRIQAKYPDHKFKLIYK